MDEFDWADFLADDDDRFIRQGQVAIRNKVIAISSRIIKGFIDLCSPSGDIYEKCMGVCFN